MLPCCEGEIKLYKILPLICAVNYKLHQRVLSILSLCKFPSIFSSLQQLFLYYLLIEWDPVLSDLQML